MSEKRLPTAGPVTRLPADPFERRMMVAGAVSVAANIVFLFAGAAIAARDYDDPNPPIEISILNTSTTVKEAVKKAEEVKKPEPPKPEPKKMVAQERPKPPRKPVQVAKREVRRPTPPRPVKPVVRDVVKPPVVVPPPPAEIEQPNVQNKGTEVAKVQKRVEAAAPAPAALKGSAGGGSAAGGGGGSRPLVAQGVANGNTRTGGGEYTDVNSNLNTATGAPNIRQGTSNGLMNPSTGGSDPKVKGVGTGTVGITSNTFVAARGTLGMPGAMAGPRNKVLVATDKAIIPDPRNGGFEIQQGAGVKAGTTLRGQGAIGGSLGNNNSAAPPKYAGGGTGAGTGLAGIKSDTFSPSRGPFTGGGGGPIGPKGKDLAASYGGGQLGAGSGDPNGTGGEGGGIVGGDGKPGKGATTRATGFGGGPGGDGSGVRVGVKDGTPGAPGFAATSGPGGGSGRGPLGSGPGSGGGSGGGVRGPGGKSVGTGPGGSGGGDKLGNGNGNGGDPNGVPGGVLGGTGKGGSGKGGNGDGKGTAQEAKGTVGGKDLSNTDVGVPDGKPGGAPVKVPAGKKVDIAAGNRIEEEIKANGGKAAGKTSAAIVKRRVEPQLSEEARADEFKKSISASFRINADGTFSVSAGSTGNSQVDAAVRKALNQWSFEPAWDNGKRVASTLNVTVNISVK